MKFYSDTNGSESVMYRGAIYHFQNGVLETNDKGLIEVLKKYYKHDMNPYEAPQGNVDEQESETDYDSMTKNQLVRELVKAGADFDKRQRKSELIDLLKQSESG